MQHFIRRCKHCGKTYTYCTYGNEDNCSMDYCGECQTAIDKALSSIPLKYECREMEIQEHLLFVVFDKIKKENKKEDKIFGSNLVVYSSKHGDFDYVEVYVHNRKKYYVKWKMGHPDEKHIFVDMEWDIQNEKFTGENWDYNEKDSYSYFRVGKSTFVNAADISVQPMSEPIGIIPYMDFYSDTVKKTPFKSNSQIKIPVKTPQVRTYSRKLSGKEIKWMFERKQTKLKMNNTITVDSLVDVVDYECRFEEINNTEYLVSIKCI